MNRILGFILVISGLVGLVACNTPGCFIEQKVVDVSANFVSTSLQCSNAEAIKTDITKLISGFGICSAAEKGMPQGTLANTFCKPVSETIVAFVAANGIPSSWGCSAANARILVADKLTQLCLNLPMQPMK